MFRFTVGIVVLGFSLACSNSVAAQELPLSGVSGRSFVYATTPGGISQLQMVDVLQSAQPIPFGAAVNRVPSRWAHRRRTLGALETSISFGAPFVFLTPMGDSVGNGAIHMVDGRAGAVPASVLVPTGNPAGYDLAVVKSLRYVFSAEDNGLGGTTLRGFSWAAVGSLTPLSPASITLPGPPAAYVNRIGIDEVNATLHVPTATGVAVVSYAATVPQMTAGPFVSTGTASPATNPARFVRNGVPTWIMGTCTFSAGTPVEAGFRTWTAGGATESGVFGIVPSAPSKSWVPAAGAEELAVVSDGTRTWAYFLLREPGPGTFFVKGSAIGAVSFLVSLPAAVATIPLSDEIGEPFAIPTVHGGRVAFETSFGPPFVNDPADGGERVCILYSPLDTLGLATLDGLVGMPAPLGGRISTKGMDRPIWSTDGSRVFAATSWFPGAPNPGLPGLEVLDVPLGVAVNEFVAPHTVVGLPNFPDQSITFPSAFVPRIPGAAAALAGLSAVGNVSNDGLAALVATPYGEIGQKHYAAPAFVQSPQIPNFRAINPPTFQDTTGSLVAVPATFGARRTSFSLYQQFGLIGLVMVSAQDSAVQVQPTGYETLAELGLLPPVGSFFTMSLAGGALTTSEIFAF